MDYEVVNLVIDDGVFWGCSDQSDYWNVYGFSIMTSRDGEDAVKVGHMKVSKLNVGTVERDQVSLFEAFDQHSIETSECYDEVFDEKGNVRAKFQDERYGLGNWLINDFHFLESISIDERYRGRGLVGKATAIYLENFANSSDVVYFKGIPLQFDASGKSEPLSQKFKGSLKTCQSKLCRYYESQGFRRIGKTEHFFFVVDDFLSKRAEME